MAKALIARFGSIEGLVAAGPKRWLEVDGIGEVRANALAAALLGPERRGTASPGSETLLR
jgi:DNA repair protein RadC